MFYVVTKSLFVHPFDVSDLDMFGLLAHAPKKSILILKLGAAGKGKSSVLLGRTDDGEDMLTLVCRDTVTDYFLDSGSYLAHQHPDPGHGIAVLRQYSGLDELIDTRIWHLNPRGPLGWRWP